MIDHDHVEALLAAQALDGLDPDDRDLLAEIRREHGAGCEECARLEREFAEVAERLSLTVGPVPVRDGLEDEVVALAVRRDERPAVSRVRRALSMAAAAALLFAGGWILRGVSVDDGSEVPSPAFLAEAELVRFEGSGEGTIAVAFNPTEQDAYVLGANVPTPEEGRRYELWVFRDGRPTSGGCFVPDDGTVVLPFDEDVGTAELLAITIEPAACPDAPTSDPIFTADPATV
jgi:hypothetical protein